MTAISSIHATAHLLLHQDGFGSIFCGCATSVFTRVMLFYSPRGLEVATEHAAGPLDHTYWGKTYRSVYLGTLRHAFVRCLLCQLTTGSVPHCSLATRRPLSLATGPSGWRRVGMDGKGVLLAWLELDIAALAMNLLQVPSLKKCVLPLREVDFFWQRWWGMLEYGSEVVETPDRDLAIPFAPFQEL
ncbi:hypothetical protein K431DRAFT_151256 [Polychaeton citri CBS 116435]|uniref:Uncharacterized protein n=1 Tax=Polychaeton citri CBS 116435 TaxID=1314669 RepID=A0A9P4ULU5_9PEZI|nr:hypothetical protein K431DRAFT_151256 [Polychaeton citri CBS 116435]